VDDSHPAANILVEENGKLSVEQARNPLVDAERQFEGFETLIPFRVQDVVLVSSLYDSFILREDGRLSELLIGESLELDLQQVPGITHVSNGAEALELVRSQPRFNLIVANLAVGDMDAAELARQVRASGLDVPVVVLAYDYAEIKNFVSRYPREGIERIFLWQGSARILAVIIKQVEDRRNVSHDTAGTGVPVILVVEDNIRYYSSFLPVIYTELITQSRRLVHEGINTAHKLLRLRARPKILLCTTFEDAWEQATKYKDFLFAVISDVEFPRGGELTPDAGFVLAEKIRQAVPDVPILLQSSHTKFRRRAYGEGFSFLRKRSPRLLRDLRRFLVEECGFGDFVFRLPNRTEVGRASNLNELETRLATVPAESIAYHSERNHFSRWLMARTEFVLAQKLRPRKVSDFASLEDLRRDLIQSITEYRREQTQLLIGDFSPAAFQPGEAPFMRIGGGSLGGKARGLAFVRHLLHRYRLDRRFPGVRITVPPSVVLGTDVFDRFLSENDLLDFAIRSADDAEIQKRFVAASLPAPLLDTLRSFLSLVHFPLAVRSSSLLEDAQYQPFAGVYETFMLANHDPDTNVRLAELMEAIQRVYASTFSVHAKAYVRATPYRLEEEKMAIVLQQVVGTAHGNRFYPDFSGVLRSRNFYATPPMRSEDGVAAVALGLGRMVVEGGKCVRFCPRYPRHVAQLSSVEETLVNSQCDFWGLELEHRKQAGDATSHLREACFGLDAALADGTLHLIASTYSADNHAVYDGLGRAGVPVVSFAPILKHDVFPLAPILVEIMKISEDAFGRPVEIEFAVNRAGGRDGTANFAILQVRPMSLLHEGESVPLEDADQGRVLCRASPVLGNGRVEDLRDVVVVDAHRFERARSQEVARDVAEFNARLAAQGTPYLLIGVGRWGSREPWMGIPVGWDQISGARVIVEAGFHDFRVTPSQGSHFFQNLTAFQVGYFTVNPDAGEGFVDWQWLAAQPAVEELGCVRHLRFRSPLVVMMNGRSGAGVILKPESSSPVPQTPSGQALLFAPDDKSSL
jgi:CheY-like chemotaxis protein